MVARDQVQPFLERHGFNVATDDRVTRGTAVSQALAVRAPDGRSLKIHVRLCWRRDGRNAREREYSAAQLRARLRNNDWEGTMKFLTDQDKKLGYTHTLVAQYDQDDFIYAALIPCDQMLPIWERQRDISADLIARGLTGRTKKNHAMNGSSPTIWLQDDRTPKAHAVSDALWNWPGVINVSSLPLVGEGPGVVNDTFDDCPVVDSALGRDAGAKVLQTRSGYPRDPKVRAAVLRRASGACERERCGERRDFAAFLDVHHILGVGNSDRVWNCVALCPNCHREAHFAPDSDAINRALGKYASRFTH